MRRFNKLFKVIAIFVTFNLIFEMVYPVVVYGLTGGPSQPEVQSFQPIEVSDMVDPFTGGFSYNIPLMDIDGYPINLGYDANVSMDDEASWVGLGWNLNPGVINRNMRGIPDDFKGDKVTVEKNIKNNVTVGINATLGAEIFGMEDLFGISVSRTTGISYNNYKGLGFESGFNISASVMDATKSGMESSLGFSNSSHDGITTNFSLNTMMSKDANESGKFSRSIGTAFNSRSGLQYLTMQDNFSIGGDINSSAAEFKVNFALPTYTPVPDMPLKNESFSFSIKGGGDLFGIDGLQSIGGHFSIQRLDKKKIITPAFGYLYNDIGIKYEDVILDFNREKDGSFNLNTPALPLTNHTYDTYSIAAQGIQGSFRPYRGGLTYLYDPVRETKSMGGSAGGEIAFGPNLGKVGVDISVNKVTNYSGKWEEHNNLIPHFTLPDPTEQKYQNPTYESVYFKTISEKTPLPYGESFFDNHSNERPLRPMIKRTSAFNTGLKETVEAESPPFIVDEYSIAPIYDEVEISDHTNFRQYRDRRNTSIAYLTQNEFRSNGLVKHDKIFKAPDHHIAEFTITQADGTRYVFGIPAYNTKKEETTFSVYSGNVKYNTGLAEYTPDTENSSGKNKEGLDHYYENVTTPPYAHSYLLTAILGPDYSDVASPRGPSPGDLGHYVKFNYKQLTSKYKWRVPFEENHANHEENFFSLNLDHRANYTYGEKEIWYLETIVTRNYIAVFHTEKREDAYEVYDRNGGLGHQSMHRLKKISLYSRPEYVADPDNAIPIKEVHFEYDYTLCTDVPNNKNDQGKLTLKRLYFTYGTSERGRYNAYEFSYGYNPSYDMKAYDRWGNYMPNNPSSGDITLNQLPNAYFPYTTQNKNNADLYASAWLLNEIKLPSGGKILIDYESNDYAYVQDKPTMQMFMVKGARNDLTLPTTFPAEISLKNGNSDPNNFHFFELPEPVLKTEYNDNDFKNDYIGDMEYLYFRYLIDIKDDIIDGSNYEFVSGYAEIKEAGVIGNGNYYTHGWIELKSAYVGNNDQIEVNPMQKAAIQFGRLHLTDIVFGQSSMEDFKDGDFADYIIGVAKALVSSSVVLNFKENFLEPNRHLYSKDIGKKAYPDKSWIRLKNPDKRKLGGGARVKKIVISDEWGELSPSGQTSQYGKEYNYTTIDPNTDKVISSGVAAYEPPLGGDENPFRQPVYFGNIREKLLVPNDESYLEEPFGESFFPSPTIGYSKVTVTDIQYENVTRRSTGKTIHEFYTAKDFPTITRRTGMSVISQEKKPVIKFLYYSSKDLLTATQGYTIEINDMHGKPKSNTHYAKNKNNPVSKTEYIYQKSAYGDAFIVDSEIKVIYPNGNIRNVEMGTDMDIVLDIRQFGTISKSTAAQINTATFVIFVPIAIPTGFAEFNQSESRFRSAVITKVISRKGILQKVRQHDLGAIVTTENIAYDGITGEVLLTRFNNNFEDPVYSLKFPAYWHYKNMGPTYKNINYKEFITIDENGYAEVNNAREKFNLGDQLVIGDGVGTAWVSEVSYNKIKLINYFGNPIENTTQYVKVVHPGYKNMQKEIVGTIVSMSNPLDGFNENIYNDVLEASVVVYTDEWRIPCDCYETNIFTISSNNPFVIGLKGNWKKEKEYLYLTNRNLTLKNNNSDMRSDGIFSTFSPFWNLKDGKWEINDEGWVWTSAITEINAYGNAIESIDALERYSAQLYGYNNRLTTATVNNSEHRESGFDSFEDYDFTNCFDDHMSFKDFKTNVIDGVSHTGNKSILVESDNNVNSKYILIICPPQE